MIDAIVTVRHKTLSRANTRPTHTIVTSITQVATPGEATLIKLRELVGDCDPKGEDCDAHVDVLNVGVNKELSAEGLGLVDERKLYNECHREPEHLVDPGGEFESTYWTRMWLVEHSAGNRQTSFTVLILGIPYQN